MIKRFLYHLLPPSGLHRRAWRWWAIAVALGPLAYMAGGALALKSNPTAKVKFPLDRVEVIRAAERYASSLGYDTGGWADAAKIEISNDRYYYYEAHRGDDAERMSRVAPAEWVDVVFLSPDKSQTLLVKLSPDGRPLGYGYKPPASAEAADLGEEKSRALAAGAYESLREAAGLPAGVEPTSKEERTSNRVTRRYVWSAPHPSLPDLKAQVEVSVLGDKVVGQAVSAEFDPAYARANFANRHIMPQVALVLAYVLLFVVSVYGLYRYVRRTWQKEVPHARSLLFGGLASLTLFLITFQSQLHILTYAESNGQGAASYWAQLVSLGLALTFYGMMLGLAYGAGEGDVREAYPGKLTSLDALLTGRLFSRNVARALLVGAAVGGWSLLAAALVPLIWAGRPGSGAGLSDNYYMLFYGNAPWLPTLATPPIGAIQTAGLGLLLPLSFLLRRRLRSGRLRLLLIAALSFVTALGIFQEQPMPFAAGLLIAGARTALLLLLFFTFDLLTAMVGAAAPLLMLNVLYFVAQPPASVQRAGYAAAGLALASLLGAVYFLLRGREYRDEEVRPLYARHLAERMRLETEVSTAREAQVRLLPSRLPEVRQVGLAAACHPSRVVGGDFYDLFTLGEQRFAVFVAEGGNYGLGAALTIAYAKGFLMPRVVAEHTPVEIVSSLQERLAPMLEEGQEMALVYAVFDLPARTLTYARAGRYPRVSISREGRAGPRLAVGPEEQAVQAPAGPNPSKGFQINCAQVRLAPGDAVIFVTDAVAEGLGPGGGASFEGWVANVLSRRPDGALQQLLDKELEKRARRMKKGGVEDDLTAVLVHLRPDGALNR